MSDQYYDSYDLLGRTLHAILNSFEPELTGDRLVAEYEHWTGNRLNFQYYNDRFQ